MRGDGGFGRDPGAPRRRMLPAVTEVVRELARAVSADPAVLFKAARSVVADELARVKQGFESAPLDVLVRRAHRQLEKEGVAAPAAEPGEPAEPQSVSIPAPPIKPQERKAAPHAGEGPFQSAGASDLDWEKDFNIQPDDAPFRSAILPLPPRSRAQRGILPPEATAAPAPEAPAPPAPPRARLPVPERVTAPEGLTVERSGAAPIPKPPLDDLPLFSGSEPPLEPPELAPPPPPPPPAPEPAGQEESVFAPPEPRVEAPEPPSEAPAPRFEPPSPWLESPSARVEPPSPRFEPPVKPVSEMPPLAHVAGEETEPVEPAMQEFAFKAAEKPVPPRKSGKAGWFVAIAVVLAVAAGLFWAVRTFLSGGVVKRVEAPAPSPPPKTAEVVPAPAPAASAAASVPAAPSAPRATPAPKAAAAPPVSRGKAAPLLTPDWAGRPVVYVVHFSSHKDRPSAEKEAKRLGRELGKPGHAVEVDLGNKGIWYRVVIGEFATVEEARAYRAELEAKKTPGLGFVYEMRGR